MRLWIVLVATGAAFTYCASAVPRSSHVVSSIIDTVVSSEMTSHLALVRRRRQAIESSLKNLSLEFVNDIRRQAMAAEMNKLYWSENLAKAAQAFAETCVHSMNIKDVDEGQGQIRYGTDATRFSLLEIATTLNETSWQDTENYYYRVVVWSTAMEIGCGYTVCDRLQGTKLNRAHYLVCNLSPIGDVLANPPFTPGDPCSRCSSDVACDNGLCDWKAPRRPCERCSAPGYLCLDCPVGFTPFGWSEVCSGKSNITIEPRHASTEQNRQIQVIYDKNFPNIVSLHVLLKASLGGGQAENVRFLIFDAQRTPHGFSFIALRQNVAVEGIPWQMSVVLNWTRSCDLQQTLAFYGEPTITSILPRRMVLSGGTRLTVKGSSLGAVNQAVLLIHLQYTSPNSVSSNVTYKGDCPLFENKSIICITPVIDLPVERTKRASSTSNNHTVNNERLVFSIEVKFDGLVAPLPVGGGRNDCGGICVYQDPHVEQWNPLIKDYGAILAIQGERLNLGVSADDYHISVGDGGTCRVTNIAWNLLHCEPPVSPPALLQDGDVVEGARRVLVNVGYLTFHVGKLRYASADGLPWPLIAGCAGGGLLLVIIIVAAASSCCCRKTRADNSRRPTQAFKSDGYLTPAK